MAQHNKLYQHAIYYDIALKRDVNQEVDFVLAAYRHHVGSEPQSMLDIACGPGYHARACARRGLQALGLDLRPEMLNFARNEATAEGVEVTWLVSDMRYFQLETPVDIAVCMFDGIDALLTNEDVIQHFRTVAANLSPDGLYLIEYTHPRDCYYHNYGTFHYAGERDDITVDITWATNHPSFNPVTGLAQVEIEMRINENGHSKIIRDSAWERLTSPQEIRLLADMAGGIQIAGWYGNFDLDQPLDNSPASQRMIAVLQKTNR
jgi:SAM-dependent methyltransferase